MPWTGRAGGRAQDSMSSSFTETTGASPLVFRGSSHHPGRLIWNFHTCVTSNPVTGELIE